MLTPLPVPPLPKRFYVFTKDLDQLRADLEATDDKAAVIQRYSDAVVAKSKVFCKSYRVLVSIVLMASSLRTN